MLELTMIRHGAVQGLPRGAMCGVTDCTLSEAGIVQSKKAGIALRNQAYDAVYCSKLTRAKQTLELIAEESGIDIKHAVFDDRLGEMNFGSAEKLTFEQISKCYPKLAKQIVNDRKKVQFPDGESVEEFINRIDKVLKYIVNKHMDDKVLLVAHGGVIRTIACILLGLDLRYFAHFACDHGKKFILYVSDDFSLIKRWNA